MPYRPSYPSDPGATDTPAQEALPDMISSEAATSDRQVLRDGRTFDIALATREDAELIAREHPLPTMLAVPEAPLRVYYQGKAWLYVTARQAGVVLGKVDQELAGFVFFTASSSDLRRRARSLAAGAWGIRQLLTGRLGGPRLWLWYARWVLQHFRPLGRYRREQLAPNRPDVPDADTQIGTVHTVERFRRLGVASALLDVVEGVLSSRGASEVCLWAAVGNEPALQLYTTRGYKKLAEVERIGERCWLMSKELASAETVKG